MPWLPYTTGHDLRKSGKHGRLPQEAVAEKVELTLQYLSRLEAGHQCPSVETVAKLADALYVELWELFDLGHQGSVKEVRVRLRKWNPPGTVNSLLRTCRKAAPLNKARKKPRRRNCEARHGRVRKIIEVCTRSSDHAVSHRAHASYKGGVPCL